MDAHSEIDVPRLAITRLRVVLQATGAVQLPAYQGSTWRGIFGHLLKRTVCVTRVPHCKDCQLYHSCAHAAIFETPVAETAHKMRRYTHAPHPYVFELPWRSPTTLAAGESIEFGLTLVGHAQQYLPYIVAALQAIERQPVGKGRAGQVHLRALRHETAPGNGDWQTCWQVGSETCERPLQQPAVIPEAPDSPVTLQFHTPLRLNAEGKLVNADSLQFHHVFRNVLRRVSMLSYFHGEQPYETDFARLCKASHEVVCRQRELRWQDWARYSSRQREKIKMGGLRGQLTLERLPKQFWPVLWLGQWLHAGKGASMGLGHYSLQAASLPAQH